MPIWVSLELVSRHLAHRPWLRHTGPWLGSELSQGLRCASFPCPPWGVHTTPGTQDQSGNHSVHKVLVDFGTGQIWGDLEVGEVHDLYEHISNRKQEFGE